jgi:DNA-directed RNA polymerase sigma subunit (sigma70/sigma32)
MMGYANKVPRGYLEEPNEAWQRYRMAYEMHDAGESYAAVGKSFGVSPTRARQMAERWARRLRYLEKSSQPEPRRAHAHDPRRAKPQ